MSAFDLCWSQLMSSIKYVELKRTMQWGVHPNKSCLDLMQNAGDTAINFYYERKKVRPLSIWLCRTIVAISLPMITVTAWIGVK
jgi:hypothetical protein